MTQNETLRAKLDEIGERITDARDQLKLKGLFHQDHKATADELMNRYKFLSKELDEEVADIKSQGVRVGALGKSVLGWVNAVRIDQ